MILLHIHSGGWIDSPPGRINEKVKEISSHAVSVSRLTLSTVTNEVFGLLQSPTWGSLPAGTHEWGPVVCASRR